MANQWRNESKWTNEQWCIFCPLLVTLGKTWPVRYSRRQMFGPLHRVFCFSRIFFEDVFRIWTDCQAKPAKESPPSPPELPLRRQIWVFFDLFFFFFIRVAARATTLGEVFHRSQLGKIFARRQPAGHLSRSRVKERLSWIWGACEARAHPPLGFCSLF